MVKLGSGHTLVTKGGGGGGGGGGRGKAARGGAVGRLTLGGGAKRKVARAAPKVGAGKIRRKRPALSNAARAAAGMWAHDKWAEEDGYGEDEGGWSGPNGVSVVTHGAASQPKVTIQRGGGGAASSQQFQVTLNSGEALGGGRGGGGARRAAGGLGKGAAAGGAPSRGNIEGQWKHDMFRSVNGKGGGRAAATAGGRAKPQLKLRGRGGRAGRGKAAGRGRGKGRGRGGRAGGRGDDSRSLAERIDMALS